MLTFVFAKKVCAFNNHHFIKLVNFKRMFALYCLSKSD